MGIDESGRRCVPRPQFTPRLGDGVVVIVVVVYVDCGVVDFMLDAVIVFNWSFAEVLGRCFFCLLWVRPSVKLSVYVFSIFRIVCCCLFGLFLSSFLRHLLPLLASRGAVSNRVNKWPRPRCCDWCCAVLVGWLAQTTDSD